MEQQGIPKARVDLTLEQLESIVICIRLAKGQGYSISNEQELFADLKAARDRVWAKEIE